jgi:hypothetical protein
VPVLNQSWAAEGRADDNRAKADRRNHFINDGAMQVRITKRHLVELLSRRKLDDYIRISVLPNIHLLFREVLCLRGSSNHR